MKLKVKLKSNSGSAMILAIVLTLLVSILAVTFSTQIAAVIRTNSRSYSDMQIKYNLEAGIEKVISEVYTKMESQLKNIADGCREINDSEDPTISSGKLITIPSITISNYDIQVSSVNDKVNYILDNDITVNLNVEVREHTMYNQDGSTTQYKSIIKKEVGTPIVINISTKRGDKQYKAKFEVNFMVTDIKNRKVGYSIIQWNSK